MIAPAKAWLFSMLVFWIGLATTAAFLWYWRAELLNLSNPKLQSAAKPEWLDEAKFKLIEEDYTRRQQTYAELETQKPATVDPGM